MAIDKAVDSGVLEAGLKQIADAIRAKGGTTDNMAFPDGFASLIEAIESGGGGIPGPDNCTIQTGTYTPVEFGNDVLHKIRHDKIGTPEIFLFWKKSGLKVSSDNSGRYYIAAIGIRSHNNSAIGGGACLISQYSNFNSLGGTTGYGLPFSQQTVSNAVFRSSCFSTTTISSYGIMNMEPGVEYIWAALG